MNEKLDEALNFFGLERDFTREDWHDIYRLLGKKNHPDVSYNTEEYMKLINSYKSILENYEVQNRLVIQEKLELKKRVFAKMLHDHKKDYNYSAITNLINKYLVSLNEIKGFKKLDELKRNYLEELNIILLNIKKKEEINLNHKKESYKKYFMNKFIQFYYSHNLEECLEASKILNLILELLLNAKSNKIDDLIKKIGNISFEDLTHDMEILRFLESHYEVYINKNHGNYVLVEKSDDKRIYYRRNINDVLVSMNNLKFYQEFLSLSEFMQKSEYVAHHYVYLVGHNLVRDDLPLSRYLYYDAESGLMLVYKADDPDDKFSFYSGNVSYGLEDIGYHFEIDMNSKRKEPENGLFRDRDFLYNAIMEEIRRKNNNITLDNVSPLKK